MNVTFRLPTEELETLFIKLASDGHEATWDIARGRHPRFDYNAFPVEGVRALRLQGLRSTQRLI